MPPIPWAAILTHGPAIVAAAQRLLASTGSRLPEKAQAVGDRLDRLENASAEAALLLQEMAQQVHALAIAAEATTQRTRSALRLSVAAAILAAVACVVAIVS